MTTLRVGIASYGEMKAMTIAVARGQRKLSSHEPRIWFASTESFAKVLSEGNRRLLNLIAEKAPESLDELVALSGRQKSNLSRTLKAMSNYGLVKLDRGSRGRLTPRVLHERIELDLPLIRGEDAA
ncbi:MAG TPA: helix-turn-helix domain-containing protein [Candidatus Binataceae bacterium]|nr:helix-turn-helix domain-containing protein [Candidatus Binataceae bacterium]